MRVFLSVHERTDTAKAELHHWFTTVYHNPKGAENCGVYGTPEQVRERIEELAATGTDHLLLNPVCRHTEQVGCSRRESARFPGLTPSRDRSDR